MCNAKSLLITAAVVGVGAAIFTGGASLGLTALATGGDAAASGLTAAQGFQLAAAGVAATTAYQQAQAAKATAKANASVAEQAAQSAEEQGNLNADAARRSGGQITGAERAGYSARGVDIGEGTAASVIDQSDFFSLVDQTTARNNAAKQAWADRAQQTNFLNEANSYNPMLQGAGTLLSSAAPVAGKWYSQQFGG
jgi:hypothetical protein